MATLHIKHKLLFGRTTYCNALQHTATYHQIYTKPEDQGQGRPVLMPLQQITVQHTATHCDTLQQTATQGTTLQHTATYCNTLQHTATRCTTLQHTAHCNTHHETEGNRAIRSTTNWHQRHCVCIRCSVLQCVAVCCSVLHCVAVCCSVLR